MLYSISAFLGSLALNAALGYFYNKGSVFGGAMLALSMLCLGAVGGALSFGQSHRGTPVASIGTGLFAGAVTTAVLCVLTVVWIVLYMRGEI